MPNSKRQRKQGYGIPPDFENLPTVCFVIEVPDHKLTRDAVYSQMMKLGVWWRWEKSYTPGDRRATNIAALFRDLIYRTARFYDCSGGGDPTMTFELRQNPDNPCQLQQNIDNAGWTLAYDFSLCDAITGGIQRTIETEVNISNTLNTITNNYDGTITSISNELAVNYDTNLAMCYALNVFVTQSIEAYIRLQEAREDENETIPSAVQLGLLAASAALSLFATPAGGTLFYAAVGTAIAGGALGTWLLLDNFDAGDLRDSAAQDAVACYIYNQFGVDLPTESEFANALQGNILTGAAADIAEVVEATLANTDTYVSFIRLVAEFLPISTVLPPCGCHDEYTFISNSNYAGLTVDAGTVDTVNDAVNAQNTTPPYGTPSGTFQTVALQIDFDNQAVIDEVTIATAGISGQNAAIRVWVKNAGGTWDYQGIVGNQGNEAKSYAITTVGYGVRIQSTREFNHSVTGLQIAGHNIQITGGA